MLRRISSIGLFALFFALVVGSAPLGCSDDSGGDEICDNGKDDDGDGKTDCDDSACAASAKCGGDSGVGGGGDGGGGDDGGISGDASAAGGELQTVIDKLTLPTTSSDFAVDLDGDGTKENQLGAIIGAVKTAASALTDNLQKTLDTAIKNGTLLMLLEVFAKDLTDYKNAKLQAHLGKDSDGVSSNNFSGSAELLIDAKSPKNAIVSGSISGGKLEAKGTIVLPLPFGTTPTLVTLKKAVVTGTLSTSGITKGTLAGAVSTDDVNNKLVPAVASMLDFYYKDANTPQADKDLIKKLFDIEPKDKPDGKITASELKNNPLVGLLLKADVDTDGDKKKDALSAAVTYSAVSCKIKR